MFSEMFRDGRDIVWKWFNHALEGKPKDPFFFTVNWVLPATLITVIGLWTIGGIFSGVIGTATSGVVSLGMGGLGYCQHATSDTTYWTKCEKK